VVLFLYFKALRDNTDSAKDTFISKLNTDLGKIIARYKEDLESDIEYNSGGKFIGKDLLNQRNLYAIDDLLSEMEDYFNNIVDLYNQVFNAIKDEIQINPFMKTPTVSKTTEYNMDKFF
jgi:hypothetical protein